MSTLLFLVIRSKNCSPTASERNDPVQHPANRSTATHPSPVVGAPRPFTILGVVSAVAVVLPLAVGVWLASRLHTLAAAPRADRPNGILPALGSPSFLEKQVGMAVFNFSMVLRWGSFSTCV